jgi:hypothetical protein
MATAKKRKQRVEEEDEDNAEEIAALDEHEEDESLEMYRVVPESPRIRALIYSEPGAGKTTLASTAQDHDELAPVVFGNIEGGMLSIAHRKDIHAVDIRTTDGLYKLYRLIKNKRDPFGDISTLVLDNLTEFQTLNLDEIVQKELAKDKNPNRNSPDEIWQEDYGVSTVQLLRLIRWFKNLDINLIITAHAKFVFPPSAAKQRTAPELQNVDPIAVLPMLTQKLCKGVMGMVDFVWFMEYDPEENVRRMLTRPDGIRQAKTRGPRFAKALGPIVINPTMPELYDLLVKSSAGKLPRKEK